MSAASHRTEGDKNRMKQSTLHQLWLFLFVATLVATCVSAAQLAQGHGSISAVMGLLAVVCFTTAQVFKRATILLWILAFIFVTIALFTALHSIRL
jgi:hypothetical protein